MVFILNWFALIAYYFGALFFFVMSIPLHELGHLLFGLLTGYRFVSFSLFSFTWTKVNGKLRMGRSPNKALSGQCLMNPPEREEDFRYLLYNFGGGLMNLIVAAGLLASFLALQGDSNATFRTTLLIGCFMNTFMAFTNLLPLDMGVPTDGLNVLTAAQSPEAKHGFFVMLHTNDKLAEGKRYRDFDPALFAVSESADLGNFFVANLVLSEAARLYDLGDFDGAFETLEKLNPEKLPPYYGNSVRADRLYHYILHAPDYEKARELRAAKGMKKFLELGFPSVNRIITACTFFLDDNREGGRRMLKKTRKLDEQYPNRGMCLMELDYLKELEKAMDSANQKKKAAAEDSEDEAVDEQMITTDGAAEKL